MSRSNPTMNAPNPATRYFEWAGSKGLVRYYDATAKRRVDVPLPFHFILLDELATVRGWDDHTDSGIYANEVRDTRQEPLLVRSKKGGTIASGTYKTIKDTVAARGGRFTGKLYIAYKRDDDLAIGVLELHGAALMGWSNFRKDHRADIYKGAVVLTGFTEGKKGSVTFCVPTFDTRAISEEANARATALDQELQQWLAGYFQRSTTDRVGADHAEPTDGADDHAVDDPVPALGGHRGHAGAISDITDDDIPF